MYWDRSSKKPSFFLSAPSVFLRGLCHFHPLFLWGLEQKGSATLRISDVEVSNVLCQESIGLASACASRGFNCS